MLKDTTVILIFVAIGLGAALLDGTLGAHPWIALAIVGGVYCITK